MPSIFMWSWEFISIKLALTDVVQVRVGAFDVAPGVGRFGFRLRGRPDGELVAGILVWVVVPVISRIVFGRVYGHGRGIR